VPNVSQPHQAQLHTYYDRSVHSMSAHSGTSCKSQSLDSCRGQPAALFAVHMLQEQSLHARALHPLLQATDRARCVCQTKTCQTPSYRHPSGCTSTLPAVGRHSARCHSPYWPPVTNCLSLTHLTAPGMSCNGGCNMTQL
jgi:hypothetical protein